MKGWARGSGRCKLQVSHRCDTLLCDQARAGPPGTSQATNVIGTNCRCAKHLHRGRLKNKVKSSFVKRPAVARWIRISRCPCVALCNGASMWHEAVPGVLDGPPHMASRAHGRRDQHKADELTILQLCGVAQVPQLHARTKDGARRTYGRMIKMVPRKRTQ